MSERIYQLNDRTMKYQTMKQVKRQHYYLGLPGEFKVRYPQEIVFPNMDTGRADEFYSNDEDWLINLEEESKKVTGKDYEKYGKYAIFGEYMYSKKYYLAVLCHEDPENEYEFFEKSPSVYIKIHYYYLPDEELWAKYDNVISNIEHNIELSDMEALDIAFIPKFISKEHKAFVTESLSKRFKNAIIPDEELKMDVAVILGAMILKNIENEFKVNELMEDINMRQVEDEIKILARDEFGEELRAAEEKNLELQKENKQIKNEFTTIKKENKQIKNEFTTIKKENTTIKKEITAYKTKIEELRKIGNLDSPEAKKIINNLLLL